MFLAVCQLEAEEGEMMIIYFVLNFMCGILDFSMGMMKMVVDQRYLYLRVLRRLIARSGYS